MAANPMKWAENFDLFLFDLDGLLVNTEELHFDAYRTVCGRKGMELKWSFDHYCSVAHQGSDDLQHALYGEFPHLQDESWDAFYADKKNTYLSILKSSRLALMPGVEKLLKNLAARGVKRCVATHSAREQVEYIRSTLPVLQTIPLWVTRESYDLPKPAPDAYLKAIELLGDPQDRVVGFEDSMRGIMALKGTRAHPVLICSERHPQLKNSALQGVTHFGSFETMSARTRL